ncbi:hypothetical protein GGR56DRAFT_625411 [Xylariaceae sp. FL0804]|nr:hypothetical protein GGR56DRAFT_625411 [Xylariaceae sp. FL0804]
MDPPQADSIDGRCSSPYGQPRASKPGGAADGGMEEGHRERYENAKGGDKDIGSLSPWSSSSSSPIVSLAYYITNYLPYYIFNLFWLFQRNCFGRRPKKKGLCAFLVCGMDWLSRVCVCALRVGERRLQSRTCRVAVTLAVSKLTGSTPHTHTAAYLPTHLPTSCVIHTYVVGEEREI